MKLQSHIFRFTTRLILPGYHLSNDNVRHLSDAIFSVAFGSRVLNSSSLYVTS
jgi:hypothetical protein